MILFVGVYCFDRNSAGSVPCGDAPGMAGSAAPLAAADGVDQLVLLHLAAAGDVLVPGDVVQLVARAGLIAAVGVAGPLRGLVGRAALLAAALVDGARGDLLRALLVQPALQLALLDVLVLPLVLVAPGP